MLRFAGELELRGVGKRTHAAGTPAEAKRGAAVTAAFSLRMAASELGAVDSDGHENQAGEERHHRGERPRHRPDRAESGQDDSSRKSEAMAGFHARSVAHRCLKRQSSIG